MKRALALTPLTLAMASAFAGPVPVVTETVTPGAWVLYKGTTKQPNQFDTLDMCHSVATAIGAAMSTVSATFHCKNDTSIAVVLTPGPQPQGEFQMLSCPAGSTSGAQWRQDRDYVTTKTPPFWKATAWTPTKPQAGACPPAPPPPAMHAGLPIDEAAFKKQPVHAGITTLDIGGVQGCDPKLPPVPGATCPGETADAAAFRTVILPVDVGFTDHIVYPNGGEHAHGHIFFGNTSASSDNPLAMLNCRSTARGGVMNCSGAWAPALMWDWRTGVPAVVRAVLAYYKAAPWTDWKQVKPIPPHLVMIAGNPLASDPVRFGPVGWSCNGFAQGGDGSPDFENGNHPHKIPQCAVGQEVWTSVAFPPCWNGKELDSPDHKSHMSYTNSPLSDADLPNGCPKTHPVLLPQVTLQAIYPVLAPYDAAYAATTADTYKKTDPTKPGGYGMHFDYHAFWRKPNDGGTPAVPEDYQAIWIARCINDHKECQAHMLGDGRIMNGFDGN